jgi:hypothetical protein
MRDLQINRITSRVILVCSFVALIAVLSGYAQPPQQDEGTTAHIFQLSIVSLVPATLLFLGTMDKKHPSQGLRALALPATALFLAFAALYYLEHYR